MMDIVMIAMNHMNNRIYFKKDILMKEIEDAGTATCMITRDVILEANTLNRVEVQLDPDLIIEGNLFTSAEATQKGLWLAHTKLPDNNIFLIHNMNETEVKLEKHMIIAQISPVNKALSCWSVFDPDSTDEEEEHIGVPKLQGVKEQLEDVIDKIEI